jgi:hypothetical protein
MLQHNTTEKALATRFERIDATGKSLWRTEYLGPPASSRNPQLSMGTADFVVPERDSPQSFRIQQDPGLIIHPHFHFVDQFQVVVEGAGTIGRNQADPITVHYAAAHTGYGPITAGPEGLTYVTMRAQSDCTGAQYLPAARSRMQNLPKRYRLAEPCPSLSDAELMQLQQSKLTTLLQESDGLAAWVLRLPAGAITHTPDPAAGGGQSMFLNRGSMVLNGAALDKHSCLYLSSHEAPLEIQAGPQGLELVICQFALRP